MTDEQRLLARNLLIFREDGVAGGHEFTAVEANAAGAEIRSILAAVEAAVRCVSDADVQRITAGLVAGRERQAEDVGRLLPTEDQRRTVLERDGLFRSTPSDIAADETRARLSGMFVVNRTTDVVCGRGNRDSQ